MESTSEQFKESIKETQKSIKQLQKAMQEAKQKKQDTSAKMDILNSEYGKLAQLRLDHAESIKNEWQVYCKEQRDIRKADAKKRQIEFDEELSAQDKERKKTWNKKKLTSKQKVETCQQLIELLKDQKQLEIVNDTDFHIDTSVIILPSSIMELFWALDMDPPIMKSEIDSTITLLSQMI
ncbi:hypothetical protein G6F70_004962 [Rhizopus microsporus]|nr:hypothetical protein G6F71_001160 [Rhizopus microsporus]KAG1199386.1 hypothetical protein G6F70_004962 [Rhizopus microsporus]KAG1214681.1 hypothetical protein G6F69_001716 [Rhizopus microsporus]KAG1236573.1 hypothetical protein G6F67_001879 [Rhizopus microsporus]KAG1268309.1 hypothetical protein G6F68_001217 [Rhizopus microsporus]